MLIRSIFTTLAGSDRICATIGRFTNFTNNSLSKSFRCSKTEKDARIMEFGCFRANQRGKSCLISLIKPRVRSGAECRPTLLVWRWHLCGLVYLWHIFCYRDYTGTYNPLFLFPTVRRDFCFLWLAIAANAREEKVSESDRPKKAGKREQQDQSEERRKHLWWWSLQFDCQIEFSETLDWDARACKPQVAQVHESYCVPGYNNFNNHYFGIYSNRNTEEFFSLSFRY